MPFESFLSISLVVAILCSLLSLFSVSCLLLLTRRHFRSRFSPQHCGPEKPRIQIGVLSHSLIRLLVCLDHSLTYFAHSRARGTVIRWLFILGFSLFLPTVNKKGFFFMLFDAASTASTASIGAIQPRHFSPFDS